MLMPTSLSFTDMHTVSCILLICYLSPKTACPTLQKGVYNKEGWSGDVRACD